MKIADWTTKGLICGHCGKVMGAANDKATAEVTLDHVLVDHFRFTRETNGWSRDLTSEFTNGFHPA